jgi:glycerol-3-phosphate dehydrogenase
VLSILNKNDIHSMKSLIPSQVMKTEVLHGVREEMAQTLSDVVFRRTEIGSAGRPGNDTLRFCAEVMATELGWSQSRIDQEIDNVTRVFPNSAYNDISASKELADSIVQ